MVIRHATLRTKDNRYEYFLTKEDHQYEYREETNGKVTDTQHRSSLSEAKELFDTELMGYKEGLIRMDINFTQGD